MKLLLAASMIFAVFGMTVSTAVGDDVYPGWAPSNCTPPLAAITMGPKGLVSIKTGPDVLMETRPGSNELAFRRPGFDGSAVVSMERNDEGRTSVRFSDGGMRTNPAGPTLYVYLPGGTVCPHGAPPPGM